MHTISIVSSEFKGMTLVNIVFVLTVLYIAVVQGEKGCPDTNITNGVVDYLRDGNAIAVSCNENYILYGREYLKCSDQGLWSPQEPLCISIKSNCPKLKPVNNKIKLKSPKAYHGSVVSFKCQEGLRLTGAERVFCDGRRWSDKQPTCVKFSEKGNNTCNFDSVNNSFCGWTQENDDDFDWTRWSGKSPYSTTGPSADHTRGDSQGHYVFIETTGLPTGVKASLSSMLFRPSYSFNRCIEFYYHSFGSNTGNLSVSVKQEKPKRSVTIFSVQNVTNNSWIRGYAKVGDRQTQFSIVFEATVGGHFGHIALDDINIYECIEGSATTKTPPTPKSAMTSTTPKTAPTLTTQQMSTLNTNSTSATTAHNTTESATQPSITTSSSTQSSSTTSSSTQSQIATSTETDVKLNNLIMTFKEDKTTETVAEDISMVTRTDPNVTNLSTPSTVSTQENVTSTSTVPILGTSSLITSDVYHGRIPSTSPGHGYSEIKHTFTTEEHSSSPRTILNSTSTEIKEGFGDNHKGDKHLPMDVRGNDNINTDEENKTSINDVSNEEHKEMPKDKYKASTSYETFPKDRKENIMAIKGLVGSLVTVLLIIVIISCLVVRARTKRRQRSKLFKEKPEEGEDIKEVIVGKDTAGYTQTDQGGGCIELDVGIDVHKVQACKDESIVHVNEPVDEDSRPYGSITTEEMKPLNSKAQEVDVECKLNQVDEVTRGNTNINTLVFNSTDTSLHAQTDSAVIELVGDGVTSKAATKREHEETGALVEVVAAGVNTWEAGEDGRNEQLCTGKTINQEEKEGHDVHETKKQKGKMLAIFKKLFHKAQLTDEVCEDIDVDRTLQGMSGTDAEMHARLQEVAICIEEQTADKVETNITAEDDLTEKNKKIKSDEEKRRKKEELKENNKEAQRLRKKEKETKKKKSEIKQEMEQIDEKQLVTSGEEKELIMNGVGETKEEDVEETSNDKDDGIDKDGNEESTVREASKDAILDGLTTNHFDLLEDDRVPEKGDRQLGTECGTIEDPDTLINDGTITADL